jgi:hypothetical protein
MQLNWWGLVTIIAGGGLDLLAAELGKVLPGPEDQFLAIAGVVAIIAGLIVQLAHKSPPAAGK